MKMRKSTWLLLVLALVAIFLVAGCTATTPPNGEEPNGEEPPPTPPADKECPEVVKTEVSKLYVADPTDLTKPNFQIKITFDENINSSCIENLAKWAITVANTDRVGTPTVTKLDVDVDGKIVTVKARVVETGTAPAPTYEFVALEEDWEEFDDLEDAIDAADTLIEIVEGFSPAELASFYFIVGEGDALIGKAAWETFVAAIEAIDPEVDTALAAYNDAFTEFGFTVEITQGEAPVFYGLICNKDDVAAYEKEFGLAAGTVKYADKVTWKLSNCAVYDELGNVCCDYEGEACCVEPYCEECPEPEEGCDLTEPGACLQVVSRQQSLV